MSFLQLQQKNSMAVKTKPQLASANRKQAKTTPHPLCAKELSIVAIR